MGDTSELTRSQPTLETGSAILHAKFAGGSLPAAAPAVDLLQDKAALHLTRGKGEILKLVNGQQLNSTPNQKRASAIQLTGTVLASADSEIDLDHDWRIHLMQFFFLQVSRAYYAGKSPSEGYVFIDLAGPSLYAGYQKFVLDGDPNHMPYCEVEADSVVTPMPYGTWQAKVAFNDHPFNTLPLSVPNPAAGNKANYLFHVSKQFTVVTTLVAYDRNAQNIQPLCWLEWGAFLDATMRWQKGKNPPTSDLPVIRISSFAASDPVQGTPPHKGIAALLNNPPSSASDTFNAMWAATYIKVFHALKSVSNTADLQTKAMWDKNLVPADHFA